MNLLCTKCRELKHESEFKFNIKTRLHAKQCIACQMKARKLGVHKRDREIKKLQQLNDPR